MDATERGPASASRKPLHRNVKLFGLASLLNNVASGMVVPVLPDFLIKVLGGSKAWLGAIEGAADSASSLVKLGSGGWSDRVRSRKWFVVPGYAIAAITHRSSACSRSPGSCWPYGLPIVSARASALRRGMP